MTRRMTSFVAAMVAAVCLIPAADARHPGHQSALSSPADDVASTHDSPLVEMQPPDPVYPKSASGVSGWVRIECLVTPHGRVRDIRIVESEPAGVFDKAAIAAMKRARFEPFASKQPRALVQRLLFEPT
jgi:TonB family protein